MIDLAINGGRSEIARVLVKDWLIPHQNVVQVRRGEDMPTDAHRYLFCQGLLRSKPIAEQTEAEIVEGFAVNYDWVAEQVRRIVRVNDLARICVIGSESGFSGSFDPVYAAAKRKLHEFVNEYPLRTPDQQLVCIAPSIIGDAGMTVRRKDIGNLSRRMETHPKRRFLAADEVAALVYHVLYVDRGYLSGVTLRMNGGAHNAAAT